MEKSVASERTDPEDGIGVPFPDGYRTIPRILHPEWAIPVPLLELFPQPRSVPRIPERFPTLAIRNTALSVSAQESTETKSSSKRARWVTCPALDVEGLGRRTVAILHSERTTQLAAGTSRPHFLNSRASSASPSLSRVGVTASFNKEVIWVVRVEAYRSGFSTPRRG